MTKELLFGLHFVLNIIVSAEVACSCLICEHLQIIKKNSEEVIKDGDFTGMSPLQFDIVSTLKCLNRVQSAILISCNVKPDLIG